MEPKSSRYLRKRKMLLILPIISLPFITLAFWALGGGKIKNKPVLSNKKGLNMELPPAVFGKQKDLDKLGYYQKADSDSDKIKAMIRNDPFAKESISLLSDDPKSYDIHSDPLLAAPPYSSQTAIAKNEAALLDKLDQLKKALHEVDSVEKDENEHPGTMPLADYTIEEQMKIDEIAASIHEDDPNENKQLDQLNGMLDKILAIQHPNRLKKDQGAFENDPQVYVATLEDGYTNNTVLDNDTVGAYAKDKVLSNGFYAIEVNNNEPQLQNAIEAQVSSTQTLVSGGIVKLRLLSGIHLSGRFIAKNRFVYGVATLSGERLLIDIKNIRSANNIYPVKLKVYDLDGIEGIYIPGTITTNALKQSADQTIQTLGINSISNSLSVQAASAGIEALKNMVSKKVKLIKVTVKAGYRVLLLNEP